MSDLRTGVDPDFPRGSFDLSRLIESATYCRVGDEKRPSLVGLPTLRTTQVCPDDLTKPSDTDGVAEGAPPNWFVRVVFDELLDPSVEELIPQVDGMGRPTGIMLGSFTNTKPVTLKCNGLDVMYNGYYVPNGNRISWPLGPALFVQPAMAVSVPVGASCEVGLQDNVRNKKGQAVAGPKSFTYKIAPMKLRYSNPDPADDLADDNMANGSIVQDVDSTVDYFFTAAIGTLPAAADIQIIEGPNVGSGANPAVCAGTGAPSTPAAEIAGTVAATTALIMSVVTEDDPDHAWKENTTYRITFGATASITAKQGGPAGSFPAGYSLCFHTETAAM